MIILAILLLISSVLNIFLIIFNHKIPDGALVIKSNPMDDNTVGIIFYQDINEILKKDHIILERSSQ